MKGRSFLWNLHAVAGTWCLVVLALTLTFAGEVLTGQQIIGILLLDSILLSRIFSP